MAEETPTPENPEKTPTDILISAMEEAEEMEDVIVIYRKKDGTHAFKDNSLCIADAVFLVESFKFWVLRAMFAPPAEGK